MVEIEQKLYNEILTKLNFMLQMTDQGIKSKNTSFIQRQALKIERKSLNKLLKQL